MRSKFKRIPVWLVATPFIALVPLLYMLSTVLFGSSEHELVLTDLIFNEFLFSFTITVIIYYGCYKIIKFFNKKMPWGSSNLILRLILETLLILSYATVAMSIQTIVWRQFRVCTTTLGEDLYRNILIALIITIIVAIINEAVILFNRFRKAELEASSLREENLTAQLAFLKNQINPHFLFNSLNSIYFLVEKSPAKAKDLISNFSEVLSHLLYESKGKYVPLSKELEYLQNYVELERVRQGDVVHFNSKIEAPGNIQVPPLIITTVVENAFKHGFGSGMDNYKIDFYIHSDEKNLTIECSNTFKRLSEQSNNGKGIGLKNLKRRLNLLYDDQYKLIIEDEEPMFIVKLSIPIKNELD